LATVGFEIDSFKTLDNELCFYGFELRIRYCRSKGKGKSEG